MLRVIKNDSIEQEQLRFSTIGLDRTVWIYFWTNVDLPSLLILTLQGFCMDFSIIMDF